MARWFRFYDEALDDPKVQRLPGDLFKAWINLLCLASRNGGVLPCIEDAAFALRMEVTNLRSSLDALTTAGLIDAGEDLRPHGWASRQYDSDSSAERVRRYRSKRGEETGAVTVTATTPLPSRGRTDTEQIQNRTDTEQSKSAQTRARKRAALVEIPEEQFPETLRASEFIAVWRDWERHRREKRATLTASTAEKQIALCADLGAVRAARMIRASILAGWVGLFERSADADLPTAKPSVHRSPNAILPSGEELSRAWAAVGEAMK